MLRKVVAALLVAMPLGMAAAPAGAQTTPAPTPKAALTPDATDRALLAYGLFVADVQYELGGRDGTVAVSLFGPPQPEMPDQIFAVVWATEPLRFDTALVRWSSGQVVRTYPDLEAQFGPRPVGFDQRTVVLAMLLGGGFSLDLDGIATLVIVIVAAAIVAVAVVVILFVWVVIALVRRRRLTTVA